MISKNVSARAAIELDRAYEAIADNQSFVRGRDTVLGARVRRLRPSSPWANEHASLARSNRLSRPTGTGRSRSLLRRGRNARAEREQVHLVDVGDEGVAEVAVPPQGDVKPAVGLDR